MAEEAGKVATQSKRGLRDRRIGRVVSTNGDKTIRVQFDYTVMHRKYGKYIRRSTMLHSHDEKNEAKVDDVVEVVACRPLSKTKHWRLTRILRTA